MDGNDSCNPPHVGNSFLQAVMIIDLIVGLPGSIVALWIFCFRVKVWKPHIIFLFNLVLADFLLLISVPFRIHTHWQKENWVFGSAVCSINLFMLSVNRSASIAFMTVVALDRYFKVVHPHRCVSRLKESQAWGVVGLIWVAVTSLRVPLLTTDLIHQEGNDSLCRSFYPYKDVPPAATMNSAMYMLEFFLSWPVLLFCSARITWHLRKRGMSKQKNVQRGIRAVVTISAVFTFCFMPSVFAGVVALYFKGRDCYLYMTWSGIFVTCFGLNYLNSALDSVIYFYSSSTFQQTLKNSVSIRKKVRANNRQKLQQDTNILDQ
ncbi:hydroxycarboxylic acid receptor 2 [Cololabis saira]|uniref:hydroxycarboxylic acid receptor 2 n=1 Tax=Cololabis saira TaxID=129043 RepID=UPI002AD2573B|nr:hydroxycarboxylic acid receptor 2 [Cololabis saira]XP_061601267.1 hydroxycarboxylic acid receptor 2 [Cololabis saira]